MLRETEVVVENSEGLDTLQKEKLKYLHISFPRLPRNHCLGQLVMEYCEPPCYPVAQCDDPLRYAQRINSCHNAVR